MCFSCGFFLWFFGVGIVDGFRPAFRFALRLAFPVSFLASFLVSLFGPFCPFRPSLRFSACPAFRFVRFGVSWGGSFETGRCLEAGRLACRLAWRDGWALSCEPFLSARVRGCVWASRFSFRSPRLASRLFCSFRRGGRCGVGVVVVSSACLFFFLPLVSNEAGGGCVFSSRSPSCIGVLSIPSWCASRRDVSLFCLVSVSL